MIPGFLRQQMMAIFDAGDAVKVAETANFKFMKDLSFRLQHPGMLNDIYYPGIGEGLANKVVASMKINFPANFKEEDPDFYNRYLDFMSLNILKLVAALTDEFSNPHEMLLLLAPSISAEITY